MNILSSRQIHLDFHTSELIPNIGSDFDPESFAQTVSEAKVNSMTVFAKCHHGWLYYDSKKFPNSIHPGLIRKNMMPEQVKALHKRGIKAPVYITVQWDYHSATTHPEWLIRGQNGIHQGSSFLEPGFYQALCINTGYYDLLAETTKEVCELLGDELDGFFFDITGIRPCFCSVCHAEMKKTGVDMKNDDAVRSFAKMSMERFKTRLSKLVRDYKSDCTIFYNAGHVGPCTKDSAEAYSHFELESLPSGSWGYLHFPLTAKYARMLGRDILSMTGKFHTAWGDFHSLKNQAALEFECFRILSYGSACSIGDQLEPCGKLNKAAYNLIGSVYSQIAEREEWARPSKAFAEAALLTPENPLFEHKIPDSIMGATQLLDELALQFDIIDSDMDFSGYSLLIIPDDMLASDKLAGKLDIYVKNGGKILSFAKGGLTENGLYPSCYGINHIGKAKLYPDFLIAEGELSGGLYEGSEYVIYLQGEKLSASGAKPLMNARAPYFNREGDSFCSHLYTPSAKGEPYPVIFQNNEVIVFSHPIFTQYRACAPLWCKRLVANAIDLLLPDKAIRHDGPSTMTATVLCQPEKNRYTLHLLSYIPVRKSASIDIIEERTRLYNVNIHLNLPETIKSARLVPEGSPLDINAGALTVPEINGYAIIELNY